MLFCLFVWLLACFGLFFFFVFFFFWLLFCLVGLLTGFEAQRELSPQACTQLTLDMACASWAETHEVCSEPMLDLGLLFSCGWLFVGWFLGSPKLANHPFLEVADPIWSQHHSETELAAYTTL